ncbi:DNA-binding response regulator [Sporosarcina sp. P21c]|uniref:response regulator transcription factor n=1 Tax=Sporosarcina TaxID=1569 RepID=UPI000A16B396|nr:MULTISPECIES: response regulator transcription factor [Sporosarcina]ARJ37990.1 DNA-binding response regulator [Sporosarcina ureae]PIC67696.1 DNA-binding response regulator [Sporosarcina sp. P16a]PIC83688.1 DNA-binding response regulator [Sporosarcina sp. P1]PIC90555.1 DNA-binding response regulator [Sporosarcina sp. P21c]PIC93321.1 DNA-binding response regulator [Sporosarcina sp. P25]
MGIKQQKILIVEDEQSIQKLLEFTLQQAGYITVLANDGEEAVEKVLDEHPDLILLDLMLPKIDGIEVCRMLRKENIETPIIMLTAKGEEMDKIVGLEMGADDYMTKPFSPREVAARVRAVLRRTGERNPMKEKKLVAGQLTVYPERLEVYLDEKPLEFTPKEFELLVYFMKHPNRVFSRDQLLQAVWNYEFAGDSRIVDVHVSHLRDKIEENTRKPRYIKTMRGVGYKFGEQN